MGRRQRGLVGGLAGAGTVARLVLLAEQGGVALVVQEAPSEAEAQVQGQPLVVEVVGGQAAGKGGLSEVVWPRENRNGHGCTSGWRGVA